MPPRYVTVLEFRQERNRVLDVSLMSGWLIDINSPVRVSGQTRGTYSLMFSSYSNSHPHHRTHRGDGSGTRFVREAFGEIERKMATRGKVVFETQIGHEVHGASEYGTFLEVRYTYPSAGTTVRLVRQRL